MQPEGLFGWRLWQLDGGCGSWIEWMSPGLVCVCAYVHACVTSCEWARVHMRIASLCEPRSACTAASGDDRAKCSCFHTQAANPCFVGAFTTKVAGQDKVKAHAWCLTGRSDQQLPLPESCTHTHSGFVAFPLPPGQQQHPPLSKADSSTAAIKSLATAYMLQVPGRRDQLIPCEPEGHPTTVSNQRSNLHVPAAKLLANELLPSVLPVLLVVVLMVLVVVRWRAAGMAGALGLTVATAGALKVSLLRPINRLCVLRRPVTL